ncbi:chaperone DnaJ domain protein [Xylanimonas cellulosilytica DSM 15894]|uniref:Chaperone DnaJ domain protein n=1 Tax=Xylanimonas cellulosilytica (strain DSM 15894 / JCM 12276 / CECT 5975 / KCTC 9989 / LMG 20990 / NBRC 107835 / XIL07) TaxID=446471 RepID=D1BUK1_XYLCX|nr:DnaJ C-terminal domain-containing protein [Xylanimonas cellulosilytica]ACZ29242.1 chaperone DnaJ domain protein [Xylanimonas cellulosilytica DSM 15894]
MTGQDWIEKDFYAALGVPKDADDAAIKKAYRKLARQHHPDQNQGDAKAESRFKEIGEAYAVLSDAEQRKQYDALRAMAGGGARFQAGGPGGGAGGFEDIFGAMFSGGAPAGAGQQRFQTGGGGFEDILGQMFGGGGAGGFGARRAGFQTAERGADLAAATTLDFRTAVQGATVELGIDGKKVTTRIPAGVNDGQKLRIRGKGRPGTGGGEAGDLVLTVHVKPHPVFTLSGRDLRATVPVTFVEATLGAQVDVPTLSGETVTLKVPAGTPSGRVLRVKGRGVGTAKGTGDLLVTVQVAVPQKLSKKAKEALEAFAAASDHEDVRADLAARAAQV